MSLKCRITIGGGARTDVAQGIKVESNWYKLTICGEKGGQGRHSDVRFKFHTYLVRDPRFVLRPFPPQHEPALQTWPAAPLVQQLRRARRSRCNPSPDPMQQYPTGNTLVLHLFIQAQSHKWNTKEERQRQTLNSESPATTSSRRDSEGLLPRVTLGILWLMLGHTR